MVFEILSCLLIIFKGQRKSFFSVCLYNIEVINDAYLLKEFILLQIFTYV